MNKVDKIYSQYRSGGKGYRLRGGWKNQGGNIQWGASWTGTSDGPPVRRICIHCHINPVSYDSKDRWCGCQAGIGKATDIKPMIHPARKRKGLHCLRCNQRMKPRGMYYVCACTHA